MQDLVATLTALFFEITFGVRMHHPNQSCKALNSADKDPDNLPRARICAI
jgi:hypothetical protein